MNYHGKIMNIPCETGAGNSDAVLAAKIAHRDARHAAAEIAVSADQENEKLRAEIERLRSALKGIEAYLNDQVTGVSEPCPSQQARAALWVSQKL